MTGGALAVAVAVAVVLAMAGCGGGGGSSSSGSSGSTPASPATGQNVLPMVVDAGPANTNTINVPFVSVTLCTPGTNVCQTIDHVIVDTGSTGLRIFSSVLSPSLVLTQQLASNGNPLVECTQFADGYTWGPVKWADVKLGGEPVLHALAIQVIGDQGYSNVPSSCSSVGPAENTVQAFGGNGILGVAVFQQDCGLACAAAPPPAGTYYACASGAANCQGVTVAVTEQVQNPVGRLANDNNGVLIQLPAVAATGVATASGSLILGIGTQANNALGNAVVFGLDPNSGTLTTVFDNKSYSGSFIDSGSNGLFFPDAAIPVCSSGFFCPASTLQLSATNKGTNGSSGTVNFSVANADRLLANAGLFVFGNLAGSSLGSPAFDWGLPFFFGRSVFTAIEGRTTPGGSGPYVAY